MNDLFADQEAPWQEPLVPGAVVLRGFARAAADTLLAAVQAVATDAPFRHMHTPGDLPMSMAMSNCNMLN
jgi:DNA oxidative demethylase